MTKQEFLRNTTKLTDEQVCSILQFWRKVEKKIFDWDMKSSSPQVTAMIDRLDVDGDGKLNKEEFEKLMAKAKK